MLGGDATELTDTQQAKTHQDTHSSVMLVNPWCEGRAVQLTHSEQKLLWDVTSTTFTEDCDQSLKCLSMNGIHDDTETAVRSVFPARFRCYSAAVRVLCCMMKL